MRSCSPCSTTARRARALREPRGRHASAGFSRAACARGWPGACRRACSARRRGPCGCARWRLSPPSAGAGAADGTGPPPPRHADRRGGAGRGAAGSPPANADNQRTGKLRRDPAADLPHGDRVIPYAMKQQQQLLRRRRRTLNNKMIVFHGCLLSVCGQCTPLARYDHAI